VLPALLPVLIESGSVGIVWPRLRESFGPDSVMGMALEEAFRSQEAHNARVAQELGRVVSRLRDAGVEPVLIKGLAVARLYPSGLVRVAGDIDLVVRNQDYGTAREVLAEERLSFHADPEARRAFAAIRDRHGVDPYGDVDIDLHRFSTWYGVKNERFFADAECVPIEDAQVLVPRVEDHLRVLCLHFLRHGAVRPMRLCDIAVMMEGGGGMPLHGMGGQPFGVRPYKSPGGVALDWDRVLSGTAREVEQIGVTLRLAEELLGAQMEYAPSDIHHRVLPSWLVPAVVRQWGKVPEMHQPFRDEVRGDVTRIIPALRKRCPDPISATVWTGLPINGVPRLPIQLAAIGKRVGMLATTALFR
jgi:hypothetical protein